MGSKWEQEKLNWHDKYCNVWDAGQVPFVVVQMRTQSTKSFAKYAPPGRGFLPIFPRHIQMRSSANSISFVAYYRSCHGFIHLHLWAYPSCFFFSYLVNRVTHIRLFRLGNANLFGVRSVPKRNYFLFFHFLSLPFWISHRRNEFVDGGRRQETHTAWITKMNDIVPELHTSDGMEISVHDGTFSWARCAPYNNKRKVKGHRLVKDVLLRNRTNK